MRYPQQLGRSWKVFVLEPSGTLSAMCIGQLSNFVCYLHQNHPEFHGPSAPGLSHPEPSRTWPFETSSGICTRTLQHLISAIYAGTLRNLACYLHRSLVEPSGTSSAYQPSAPEPSRTSSAFCPEPSGISSASCPGTVWNLISFLPGTVCTEISSASCPGTVRNLISHLHRNPLEQQSAPEGSGTLRILL